MIIEQKSVVNEAIKHKGSITLVNVGGDLIIDAPIISEEGNIILVANNIRLTHKAYLQTFNKGNIIIQADQDFYMGGGKVNARNILSIESNQNITTTFSIRDVLNHEVRMFKLSSLKSIRNETKAQVETKDMSLEDYESLYKDSRSASKKAINW